MSRYDGLIIPRSYSEYINKTDAATLQQALQLSGVLSNAVTERDNRAVMSDAVNNAIKDFYKYFTLPINGNVTRYDTISGLFPTSAVDTNAYIITLRNGEMHLLICGSTDGGVATTPVWIQINQGAAKLQNISYDLTTKDIVIRRGTHTSAKIIQITGNAATLTTSQAEGALENSITKKIITYS
jgi:hypothetical protein